MTRCPNCGAEVREGAKFCTSCGFRLTESEAAPPPSRSPFAIPPAGAWTSPQVAEQTDTVTVDEPAQDEVQEEAVYTAPATIAETSDDVDDFDENERPGPSWYSPKPPMSSGPVSDEMLAELEGDAAPGQEPAEPIADDSETDQGWVMAQPIEEPASVGSSPWTEARDAGETNLMPPRVEPASSTDGSGALDEARQLIGRLQELLSGISGDALGGTSQATPELAVSDEDVESLRKVVASAQERPRDVDVMLDLVLRADTIAGVIQDRDTLLGNSQGNRSDGTSEQDDDTSSDPGASWPTR